MAVEVGHDRSAPCDQEEAPPDTALPHVEMECQKVARDERTNDLSVKADDYYGNRFLQCQQQVDHLVMDHPGEQEHCGYSVEIAPELDYLWIV